ncbi:MAG: alpha/beta hydrolase [Micrococcales bacterium]|nr:alpha/beta hydrolase [Micrococcales bacterium]
MNPTESSFESPSDGTRIVTQTWSGDTHPVGVVQIAHGLAEHSLRYGRLAAALVAAGYRVHASDHRGHGKSIPAQGRPGDFGEAGFAGLVADVSAFSARIAADEPGLPLYLIAHSMGSIAAQEVILEHSVRYAGVVLSGSTAVDVLGANLASEPAGADEPSGLEAFNAGFEHRTGYEWLSRDEAEVDLYVADPLCGFDLPDDALTQMFAQAARLADPTALAAIRPDLPLLLVSGQADPLSGDGQLIELLAQRYREAGLTDVRVQVYPEARHEIFNETNREAITADVIAWIDAHRAAG